MERTIAFTLNGKPARVTVDDDRMLLWVLRGDLGLTGTKFGCGAALCGACTVIVDGDAVRSCTLPMKEVAGKSVLTIEGLAVERSGAEHSGAQPIAAEEKLHPIQEAFMKHGAFQCGYCTPGMILTTYAFLRKTPRPTRQQIIDNPGTPAQGCGEPPIITTGAVLANAIHDATGARLTQLPMTPERILAALKQHATAAESGRFVGV